jgi:hypothetical protein
LFIRAEKSDLSFFSVEFQGYDGMNLLSDAVQLSRMAFEVGW